MNLLDYILIVIVAVSVVTAAAKGFFYEIWMMVGALIAIGLAAWQYPAAAAWFGWLGVPEAAHFCGFILILALVLVAAAIVGRLARKAVHAIGLGLPDRLLGAGLGLLRGLLLCVAVLAVMIAYPFRPALVRHSRLAPDLLWGSRALVAVMPAALATRFHASVNSLTARVRDLP
ncbi:MAG: CvpA family protein [Terriglobales bacterium]